MKICLVKDLSTYDEHLVIGAIGLAREDKISFNDWGGEMVEVKIPGAVALPLSWSALKIIDKKYWTEREKDIKQAKEILLFEGPRGGFKGYRLISMNKFNEERIYSSDNKNDLEMVKLLCEKYGKKIMRKVV